MHTWLIIDDHPAICFAVKAILAPLGNNSIITATNGMAALAKIKELQPQLVILDIMLNKMDGLQILQHIRQMNGSIKVIVYSSLPAEIYAERVWRAGACGFFSKEQDVSQLVPLCLLVLQGYHCFPQGTFSSLLNAPAQNEDLMDRLSDRELTVLRYLSDGLSNKEIADRLLLSNKTISTYKTRLMDKLKVQGADGLANFLHNKKSRRNDE
ncbi:Virulence factors putative positive transcription regulator BvgA [Serratia quinivorans]|uniref:response regulator transcription factor n=1 Tax=Serratia quinivorans TaxID=137545 RepID=UPI00217C8C02|nr:response regulator transcription factor [Serratia quinivorans]CAI1815136.1 Virulence factors putative positive transcription regulator BvgA [Serratia quinivorans]